MPPNGSTPSDDPVDRGLYAVDGHLTALGEQQRMEIIERLRTAGDTFVVVFGPPADDGDDADVDTMHWTFALHHPVELTVYAVACAWRNARVVFDELDDRELFELMLIALEGGVGE